MSLLDQLTQVAVGQMTGAASRKTGFSQGLVEKMLPMAVAALMGGLKKNTAQPQGAEALARALERHDGSLLDDMSRVEDDDVMADGAKILRHILGGKQETTQRALAKSAGVDMAQVGQLLAMAAPAILASLGKTQREQGLDAGGLAGLLAEEGTRAQQAAPNEMGGLLQFLDQDGDGDFKDDLLETAGKSLFGSLLGNK